jgi:hypothetical protein
MDKYSAIEFLKTEATMQDAHAQSAIAEYLDEKAPKATKAPKAKAGPAIKAKAPAKSTKASREAAALAEAAAVARAENEDAPF